MWMHNQHQRELGRFSQRINASSARARSSTNGIKHNAEPPVAGTRVRHEERGVGTVVRIDKQQDDWMPFIEVERIIVQYESPAVERA